MSASSLPPVAIVGGGPAGLTLARILQRHHVVCRVYESEPAATARNQGGSLDLHAESGLWAVEQCGLIEQFRAHSRPDDDCMRILDKTGRVHWDEDETPRPTGPPDAADHTRPEIDRLILRNMLLEAVEAADSNTMQWGHALASIYPLPAASTAATDDEQPTMWQLTFKNGTTVDAAIVIGADGAWSRIRPLLSSAKPTYTGITFVDLTVPHFSAHPQLAAVLRHGSALVLGDGRGILPQMNGNDTLRVYAAVRESEQWLDEPSGGAFLASGGPAAVDELIKRYYDGWYEPALEMLRSADMASLMARRIYALPSDHRFEHTAQTRLVTAVGDAAHLMSPFAGEGVNLAMLDAAQLALAIAAVLSPTPPPATTTTTSSSSAASESVVERLAAAIASFERGMFERSQEAAEESARNLELIFSKDGTGASAIAGMMQSMMSMMAAGGGHGHEGRVDLHE